MINEYILIQETCRKMFVYSNSRNWQVLIDREMTFDDYITNEKIKALRAEYYGLPVKV